MIYETSGDILYSRADLIAHGVAPGDRFREGLARSLREQWPRLARDFRHYCEAVQPPPGGLWIWHGCGVHVANLLTKEGGATCLSYVHRALSQLVKEIESEHYGSVALPKLGTGPGGLHWEKVWPAIEEHLGPLKIPVYVYTRFDPGRRAEEPEVLLAS